MRFANQAESDRVDEEERVLYTSSVWSSPPVPTAGWDEAAWGRWNDRQRRLRALHAEAEAAGYRVVAV